MTDMPVGGYRCGGGEDRRLMNVGICAMQRTALEARGSGNRVYVNAVARAQRRERRGRRRGDCG